MKLSSLTLYSGLIACSGIVSAAGFTEAITNGKTSADLRLRYETVEQSNALKDAKALTLRTRLGYTTGSYEGFSAKIEMEDVRSAAGGDEYTVGPTGFNPGVYSVIADPESTEIDQGYIKFKNDNLDVIYGRQVITLDNHRFIGHVGWRQDRQTFDGLGIKLNAKNDLSVSYQYITKRNRIFSENADIFSKDNLLNISYKTSLGKLSGYAYLLEVDNNSDNSLDTYGLRFNGSTKGLGSKILYTAEVASQESKNGATEFDADYLFLEAGLKTGMITAKLGYEVLGSDNAAYGFATPLATLHKFNGWADLFLSTPAQGLVDTYISVSANVAGGKVVATYHNFGADDATATIDDLGSEVDLLYALKFNKIYSAGIKYAAYSAGDSAAGKVDTDKLWIWGGVKF